MWRSMFMAFGLYVFLLGSQCLVVEKFVWKSRGAPAAQASAKAPAQEAPRPQRGITPTEWAPWSLMVGGSVIWLYAISISSRMKK